MRVCRGLLVLLALALLPACDGDGPFQGNPFGPPLGPAVPAISEGSDGAYETADTQYLCVDDPVAWSFLHRWVSSGLPEPAVDFDAKIVAALKLRGYESECGPLTMMPDGTEVIVSYEDHWTWDFGDHLAYLQIVARDRRTNQVYGSATFRAKIPTKKSIPKIIGELVDRILADAQSPKAKG